MTQVWKIAGSFLLPFTIVCLLYRFYGRKKLCLRNKVVLITGASSGLGEGRYTYIWAHAIGVSRLTQEHFTYSVIQYDGGQHYGREEQGTQLTDLRWERKPTCITMKNALHTGEYVSLTGLGG